MFVILLFTVIQTLYLLLQVFFHIRGILIIQYILRDLIHIIHRNGAGFQRLFSEVFSLQSFRILHQFIQLPAVIILDRFPGSFLIRVTIRILLHKEGLQKIFDHVSVLRAFLKLTIPIHLIHPVDRCNKVQLIFIFRQIIQITFQSVSQFLRAQFVKFFHNRFLPFLPLCICFFLCFVYCKAHYTNQSARKVQAFCVFFQIFEKNKKPAVHRM